MNESKTQLVADFVAQLDFSQIPPTVVSQAQRVILDTIGCAVAAFAEEPRKTNIAVGIAQQFASAPTSTVVGGTKAHPAISALSNGMLINATDNDDTHKRALLHTSSAVLPAALAACESRNASGKDLITAMVAGYEVAVRVGMAVMPTHYRFWHSTATNGTFGAAAAAAKAMGLGAQQTGVALGLAGTQAAGLNTFFESGDDSKSMHPGKAAMNGVLSANLAVLGMTAPPDVLGHAKGYLNAFSLEPQPEVLTATLGREWEIMNNGFKLYPSILASHSPIGASLDIVSRNVIRADQITSVRVNTYSTVKSHFSSKDVRTSMAARLSVPYCVAIALIDGQVTQRQFEEARFNDPAVRALLDKVEIVVDPELSPLYPEKFPARVVVETTSGESVESTFLYPKGDPANPLSDAELDVKFMKNTEPVLGAERAKALLAMLRSLAQHDVSELAAALSFRN
jgi:2-methylcitrate dehydratase PrpD